MLCLWKVDYKLLSNKLAKLLLFVFFVVALVAMPCHELQALGLSRVSQQSFQQKKSNSFLCDPQIEGHSVSDKVCSANDVNLFDNEKNLQMVVTSSNNREIKVAPIPAVDLKIQDWPARKLLIDQLVKDLDKDLNLLKQYEGGTINEVSRVYLEEQGLANLRHKRDLITNRFSGKIEAYVDAILVKRIDVTRKNRVYVINFMQLKDRQTISYLNDLKRKYEGRAVFCGIVSPLVRTIYPDGAPHSVKKDLKITKYNGAWIRGRIDPVAYHEESATALVEQLTQLGEHMPRFMTAVDDQIRTYYKGQGGHHEFLLKKS